MKIVEETLEFLIILGLTLSIVANVISTKDVSLKQNKRHLKRNITFTAEELKKSAKDIDGNHSALRYGFQRSNCQDYKIEYLCFKKCLYSLRYDVSYVDKKCSCTCYMKHGKPKLGSGRNIKTKTWLNHIPETSVPAWAQATTITNEQNEPDSNSDDSDEVQTTADSSTVTKITLGIKTNGNLNKGDVTYGRDITHVVNHDDVTHGDVTHGSDATHGVTYDDVPNTDVTHGSDIGPHDVTETHGNGVPSDSSVTGEHGDTNPTSDTEHQETTQNIENEIETTQAA